MHIGLIGGIGPAATDLYYRGLIARMKAAGVPLEATIVHADAPTLLRNFEARDQGAQVEIFVALTERLKRAGADAVVITSTGGHFCVAPFVEVSPLPVLNQIDMLDEGHRGGSGVFRAGGAGVGRSGGGSDPVGWDGSVHGL